LPLGVIPYRYDLLMALHGITRLLEDLPVLLIAFRRLCSTPSYRARAHLQEIQRK